MPENRNENEARENAAPAQSDAAKANGEAPKGKRPRNIVTDFYDSLNISVRQLDVALVFLCAFILIVIVLAAHFGA